MSLEDHVKRVIAADLQPLLSADDSGLELLEVDEAASAVVVRLTGALRVCPGAALVKADVIERALGKGVTVRYV